MKKQLFEFLWEVGCAVIHFFTWTLSQQTEEVKKARFNKAVDAWFLATKVNPWR